jgi:CBS domain containing-hemolysin-like protein
MLPADRRAAVRPPFRVTPETVELAVDLSTEQGAIQPTESEMILDALDTSDTKVREIMTPRPDLARLPATATVANAAELIVSTGFSRLPVYSGTVDNMVGVVFVKDLLADVAAGRLDIPVSQLMRPPFFVSETRLASDLMQEMKARGEPLAIVLDEYGGTAGVVSLEDVVEEIVGEIVDEFDRWENEAAVVDGGYIFSARLLLDDINDEYGLELPVPDDVDSIGGLVYSLAGCPPRLGESFVAGNYSLTVAELRGARVLKVRVMPQQPIDSESERAADEPDRGEGASRT